MHSSVSSFKARSFVAKTEVPLCTSTSLIEETKFDKCSYDKCFFIKNWLSSFVIGNVHIDDLLV